MIEAVRDETIDQSEGVAEVVVEAGTDDAGRQRMTNVADIFAYLIPDNRHVGGCRRPFQIDENGREARPRIATQVVEALGLLQFALDPFSDLLERVVKGRAGPGGLHDHRSERESRILAAAEPEIRCQPTDGHRDHHEDDEGTVLQRPFREIKRAHESAPTGRVFCLRGVLERGRSRRTSRVRQPA